MKVKWKWNERADLPRKWKFCKELKGGIANKVKVLKKQFNESDMKVKWKWYERADLPIKWKFRRQHYESDMKVKWKWYERADLPIKWKFCKELKGGIANKVKVLKTIQWKWYENGMKVIWRAKVPIKWKFWRQHNESDMKMKWKWFEGRKCR
jgi:hypothetical protein